MDILKDIWGFLRVRKKFWLLPAMVILLSVGTLILFAGSSVVAPFIYTIF